MSYALNEIWAQAFAPPDRRSIIEWGREKVTLPPVLAKSGKFDVAGSRHFIGPFQAVRHDRVRGVRMLAPVRGGKTLVVDVSVPWAVVNDNASVLWVFQDKIFAEQHAEERQMPILKSVPEIAPMLSDDRHKTRKNNILFANGLPMILSGPALGRLQGKGYKWVICDEPWLFKPGVLANAKARMGDFVKMGNNKFIGLSQGGEEDGEWDIEYRAGVEFVWRPQCASPACRQPMPIEWTLNRADGTRAGALFDSIKNKDGTYNADACAATARFACPHCGHIHPDTSRTRREWNATGDYFSSVTGERFDPENPPTEVSFRWHGIIDYPLSFLVKLWLEAQEGKRVGNFKKLVIFFQKYCALMRSERTVHDSDLPFARLAQAEPTDPKDKLWPEEHLRFLTADRQEEQLYWVAIRAWAKSSGESRRVFWGKVYGEAAIEELRVKYGVRPDCTVIDSGHWAKGPTGVYAACCRYGWIAAKGDDADWFWHTAKGRDDKPERVQRLWAPKVFGDPHSGTADQGRKRCNLIVFAQGQMSDQVHALIERGLWVEPVIDEADENEREFRRQMTAEFKRPKVDKLTGRKKMVWVCPSGVNHAFDDAKMQVLCAMQAKLIPSDVETSAGQETKTKKGAETDEAE